MILFKDKDDREKIFVACFRGEVFAIFNVLAVILTQENKIHKIYQQYIIIYNIIYQQSVVFYCNILPC